MKLLRVHVAMAMGSRATRPRRRRLAFIAGVATFACVALGLGVASQARASTTRYEAERAVLSGGAAVQTDHTGFSGTGFVGGYVDANKATAKTVFTVAAPAAGAYTLALAYSDGNADARTLTLTVDGGSARQIAVAPTGSWNTWSMSSTSVTLGSGQHVIAYSFGGADSGNVNLDYVDVTTPSSGGSTGPQYEAESAALSGGADTAADHAGYTGTGFVGGYTDGNKGNAATTFTVSSSAAGVAPVALRFANGTGSAKTLSVYVNGTKALQTSLNATANWDSWASRSESLTLRAGSNTIAYAFDSTDSGNINLDNIVVGTTVTPTPTTSTTPPSAGGTVYQAESAFFSAGPAVASSFTGATGTYLTGFGAVGARAVFTVNSSANAATAVNLRYSSPAAATLHVRVNGLSQHQVSLPSTGSGSTWSAAADTLTLRTGLNTITYQNVSGDNGSAANLDYLQLPTGAAMASRGATLPYQEQEAEHGVTNAALIGPSRTFSTQEAEASGRRAVKLTSNGQYVQFTLARPADSIVIRYSIPDTANGAEYDPTIGMYVNGTRARSITLNNRYSWVYGPWTEASQFNNDPTTATAADPARHFYDEVRTLTSAMPAGTVVRLQKDAADTAGYYLIDVVDFEQVDAAYTMPAEFLNVTSYGAVANDGADDTGALQSAVNAAQSQGKGLWVPPGQFEFNNHVNLANVTIRGAGPWYSILHGANGLGGLFATGSNVQILDLGISGDNTYRNNNAFHTGIEGNFGTGSMIQNVWIEHTKVGLWPDTGTTGLYIGASRVRDIMADGINIHGGAQNVVFTQSNVRNTGDDAMAMDSENGTDSNDALIFNTVQVPTLASNAAVYGGGNNRIEDNILVDTVASGGGVNVSSAFGAPFNGPIAVARNTLIRTGSQEPNLNSNYGGIWIFAKNSNITTPVTVNDNSIQDSTYSGVVLNWNLTITNISFTNDQITTTGLYGIEIISAGSGTFTNVTVTGAPTGGLSVTGGFTVIRGSGNTGW
jgi:Pectate lyase superfamily protein/Carbohydrate binding module (family 35)/Carbohydrate binding module (family 6)